MTKIDNRRWLDNQPFPIRGNGSLVTPVHPRDGLEDEKNKRRVFVASPDKVKEAVRKVEKDEEIPPKGSLIEIVL
ncbi:MAG: hypothetical protein KAQ63_01050 [Candidatus Moranbacteria bacterium]|nr:hypothetical protein [Candidatus Moranbacteria bacterium]